MSARRLNTASQLIAEDRMLLGNLSLATARGRRASIRPLPGAENQDQEVQGG
jgi:hypothetical protein